MAVPVWTFTKQAGAIDGSSYTIKDFTVYGGTYTARNLLGLVMFVTRTDKDGVRTLQTVTPNSSDPLVVSSWSVVAIDDGLLEKIIFAVNIWNSGVAYVIGDIVYNTANSKFYKAVLGGTNHVPPNATYWVEIAASALYTDEILNATTTMVVVDQFDLNTSFSVEQKVNSEYQRIADNFISAVAAPASDFNESDRLDSLLQSAYSAMDNGRPYEADEIVQGIVNYVLNYGD